MELKMYLGKTGIQCCGMIATGYGSNKIRAVCTMLFLLCFGKLNAEIQPTDSLFTIIKNGSDKSTFTKADTLYLNTLSLLNTEYFRQGEFDSMREFAKLGLARTAAFQSKAYDKDEKILLSRYEMIFNRQAGISYFNTGDYVSQLKYFQQFLIKAQEINSIKDIATAYTYMATCHREMEDNQQSYNDAQKAVQTLKGYDYKPELASAYAVISTYYIDGKANLDSAYYYRKKAYLLFKEINSRFLAGSALDLVELFLEMGALDSCQQYLDEIKIHLEKEENPEYLMSFYTFQGKVDLAKGRITQSLLLMKKASALADETEETDDNSHVNRALALSLAAAGKIPDAFRALDSAFDEYSEDLNADKIRSMTKAKMDFEFEKERAVNAVELQRQKQMRFFLAGSIAFLLLTVLFIFKRYRERHRTALLLTEKNHIIEQAYHELKQAQAELVETEKQREAQSVRVRIARDIHDDIGSGLTKITMLSDMMSHKTKEPETAKALSRITAFSKGVNSSLSEIVWAVNPVNDHVSSLVTYMKSTANDLLEDSGLNYEMHFPSEKTKQPVHPEIKRSIYLVMKEAINNALKYSDAKNLTLNFSVSGDMFLLEIFDDGKGFYLNDTDLAEAGGNGLLNMSSRMQQQSNTLSIKTSPGEGCKITASGKLI